MLPAQLCRVDFDSDDVQDSKGAMAAVVSIAEDSFKKVRFLILRGVGLNHTS